MKRTPLPLFVVAGALVISGGAPLACASALSDAPGGEAPAAPLSFSAALAGEPAAAEPAKESPPAPGAEASAKPRFAEEGYRSWTVGAGVAVGGRDAHAYYNGFVSVEWFLVDDFQFALELGGWYFAQTQDDAVGVSLNLDFRYYVLPWSEPKEDWGVYLAAGAGVLGASEDVPPGGTPFDFTPRAGVGFSLKLGEGPERLNGGIRWQHISNANIEGNSNNHGSDSLMVYLGVTFPF